MNIIRIAVALVLIAVSLILLYGCDTAPTVVRIQAEPINAGALADQCAGFINIKPEDNANEKTFLSWYGRNAAQTAQCADRHERLVRTLRDNKVID